jgi:hypothetical protein
MAVIQNRNIPQFTQIFLQQWTLLEKEPEDKPGPSCSSVDPDFLGLTVPHLISQCELDDLMKDLNLLKIQAELLASCLQEQNLLQQSVKVSNTKHQKLFS